jgi:hypothetical protein
MPENIPHYPSTETIPTAQVPVEQAEEKVPVQQDQAVPAVTIAAALADAEITTVAKNDTIVQEGTGVTHGLTPEQKQVIMDHYREQKGTPSLENLKAASELLWKSKETE